MGVRLVRYNRPITGNTDSNTSASFDHDELINRDLMNQHPIYAITGLQEILNMLEDAIDAAHDSIAQHEQYINQRFVVITKDIEDINTQLADIAKDIAYIQKLNFQSSKSVIFNHDTQTNTVSALVRIFKDPKDDSRNAIQELESGLFVPKFTSKDSVTISWKEEIIGETLAQIFAEGSVFSHNGGTNNIANATEANAWYWDENLQSFVQPRNTGSFTGFVTKEKYDYYTHSAQICSTDSDNDLNGVVIGYVVDDSGAPHTLTAVVDRGGMGGNNLRIFYNYALNGQTQLAYTPIYGGKGGWNAVATGITIEITKYKNQVSAVVSNWNTTELNEATRIVINLDDYTFGDMFRGEVKYGYCNQSQAYSFFQNIFFLSSNTASSTEIVASVNISQDDGNALETREDGLYAKTVYVSPDANNALVEKANGFYVKDVLISKQGDNILQKLSDGFFVKRHYNVKQVSQADHGFVIGDVIYYHPSHGYQLASAIDDYNSNIVGMVTKVIDASTFEYQWAGFFATDVFSTQNRYTQGLPVYISDVDPGKVTQIQPDISKTVGYPVEDCGIIISIERGIQYNQEASIGDFKTSANTYNIRSDGFIRIVEGVNYKQSLIQRLIDSLDSSFKNEYMIFSDINGIKTIEFVNTDILYQIYAVPSGLSLFIKAF